MNGTPALEPTSPESRFNQPEAIGTLPFLAVGEILPPALHPSLSRLGRSSELEDEMRASQVATRTCIRPSPRAPVYILLALRARPHVKDNFAAFSMGLELYNEPPY